MGKTIGGNDFIYIDIKDGSEEKEKVLSLMVHERKTGEYSLEIVSYIGDIEPKLPEGQKGFVKKEEKPLNLMTINSICKELIEPNLTTKFKITDIKMSIISKDRNEQGIEVDLESSTLEEVIEKLILTETNKN